MIIYDKLWKLLDQKEMKKTDLLKVISSPTLAKLGKNENVNVKVIGQLCDFLNCQPGDIMENINGEEWVKQNMYKSLENLFETIEKKTGRSKTDIWNDYLDKASDKRKNDKDFQDIKEHVENYIKNDE